MSNKTKGASMIILALLVFFQSMNTLGFYQLYFWEWEVEFFCGKNSLIYKII